MTLNEVLQKPTALLALPPTNLFDHQLMGCWPQRFQSEPLYTDADIMAKLGTEISSAAPVVCDVNAQPGVCSSLAALLPTAHIDAAALATMLNRSKKSVQRAVRRGELPRPFKLLGKHMWMAGAIVEHLHTLQTNALKQADQQAQRRTRDVV